MDFLSKLDEGRYAEFAWALAIINTDVTAKDLKRMVDIYGPSLGDLKGKTKRDRPSITDIEPVESFMREAQTLDEDLMLVDRSPILVSLSTPLDLILISKLKARTATELWSVQFRHLGIYKAERGQRIPTAASGSRVTRA